MSFMDDFDLTSYHSDGLMGTNSSILIALYAMDHEDSNIPLNNKPSGA